MTEKKALQDVISDVCETLLFKARKISVPRHLEWTFRWNSDTFSHDSFRFSAR